VTDEHEDDAPADDAHTAIARVLDGIEGALDEVAEAIARMG